MPLQEYNRGTEGVPTINVVPYGLFDLAVPANAQAGDNIQTFIQEARRHYPGVKHILWHDMVSLIVDPPAKER